MEADLERRLEVEGTLRLGEGSETAWWTYGMGLDVYGRDEGGGGGGEARGGKRDEGRVEGNRWNIRRMRRVVELPKGGVTHRDVHLYFIKSRSLADPISAVASIAGPIAKP
jgi:hypothetical protein